MRTALKTTGIVMAHLVVVPFIIPVLAAMSFYVTRAYWSQFTAITLTDKLLVLPFFPVQTVMAIALGAFVARHGGAFGRSSIGRFSWALPALWLIVFVSRAQYSVLHSWTEMYLRGTTASDIKLRIIATLPSCSSLGYCLGLFLNQWINGSVQSVSEDYC